MKKAALIIMALAGLFLSASVSEVKAQTYYYYYGNKKMPLTLNENKVVVSIPKECDKTCERIRASVQALATMEDKNFDSFIILRSEFDKLTSQDFWEGDAKSVILTSSYFMEDNREVYSTPYLSVKLKKEEDKELLYSYAENYSLRIDDSFVILLPLWYSLFVTLDSKISPLECANELYESGDFAYAEPDLAWIGIYADETNNIRSIPHATTEKSSEIYDLQGRRMVEGQPLQPGIYVKDGRKFVVK